MCIIIKFLKIDFWFLAILVFEKIEAAKRFCAGNELVLSGYWASIDLRVLSGLCTGFQILGPFYWMTFFYFLTRHFYLLNFSKRSLYFENGCSDRKNKNGNSLRWSLRNLHLIILSNTTFHFSANYLEFAFLAANSIPFTFKIDSGRLSRFFFCSLPVDSDWSKKVHNNKMFENRFWNFWDIGLWENCSRQDFLCM